MLSSSFRTVEWLTQITGWQIRPKNWVQSVKSAHTEGRCHLKYGSYVDNLILSPNSQSSQLQGAAHTSEAGTFSVSLLSLSLSRVLHVVQGGIFTFCCCNYIAVIYYYYFSHGLFISSQLWGREREVLSVSVLSHGALKRVWCRSCVPFQECVVHHSMHKPLVSDRRTD